MKVTVSGSQPSMFITVQITVVRALFVCGFFYRINFNRDQVFCKRQIISASPLVWEITILTQSLVTLVDVCVVVAVRPRPLLLLSGCLILMKLFGGCVCLWKTWVIMSWVDCAVSSWSVCQVSAII